MISWKRFEDSAPSAFHIWDHAETFAASQQTHVLWTCAQFGPAFCAWSMELETQTHPPKRPLVKRPVLASFVKIFEFAEKKIEKIRLLWFKLKRNFRMVQKTKNQCDKKSIHFQAMLFRKNDSKKSNILWDILEPKARGRIIFRFVHFFTVLLPKLRAPRRRRPKH